MSNFYCFTSLIGGGTGALDAIDGADLSDLDGAVVITDGIAYFYHLDATSAAGEDSPLVISPDANAGTKRWILVGGVFDDLNCYGGLPGSIGGFEAGMFRVTNNGGEFSNSVITGHNLFGGNTQLWYLGNTSGANNDIAFINRQNAAMHFYTNNTSRMTIDASGNITFNVIAAEGSDVDKFLVDSSGVIKFRTGAQVLSDIGGKEAGIAFVIDGGGSEIATGIKGDLEVPFDCTITAVTLLADQSGSIVIDIWKQAYADFPPENAQSITSSAVPTITTAVKSQDSTLTGWTVALTKGDTLRFNVDSVTDIERVTLSLTVDRS